MCCSHSVRNPLACGRQKVRSGYGKATQQLSKAQWSCVVLHQSNHLAEDCEIQLES